MAFLDSAHLWRNPASGYWYVVWREGGRPRRRSCKTRSLVQAKKQLAELMRDAPEGWAQTPAVPLPEAVEAWYLDRARAERRLSRSTLQQYRTFADMVVEVAPADLPVSELGPRDAQRLLDQMARERPCSPETMRKRFGLLRMLFGWLRRQEYVHRNPVEQLEPPAAKPQRKPAFEEAQIQQLLEDLAADAAALQEGPRRRTREGLRDLVRVLAYSGLRSVEALRLSWEDVDLEGRVWRIRSPQNKGGDRVQPIYDGLLDVLRRRRLFGEAGPFQPEQPLRSAWRSFKRRHPDWASADLHSLRHAFVTRLRRRGHHAAAQFLAGHKTAAMTDHYTHLGPEDFREELNQL